MSSKTALHVTPRSVPYCPLQLADPFRELTARQRLYAHHIMTASWHGTAIVAQQISPESLPLLRLLHTVLSAQPLPDFRRAAQAQDGVTADDVQAFLEYTAYLYANMGNYLSFGDSKFIPACSPESFAKIVAAGNAGHEIDAALLKSAYSLDDHLLALNFPPKGVTTYYSPNITPEDATVANDFLASRQIDAVNTRVWRSTRDDGLTIRIASVETGGAAEAVEFRGRTIRLEYGDFHAELRPVVQHVQLATKYVENDRQRRMLEAYAAHFLRGDVELHKASQREWVKDLGPTVECNLGFIERYRDPAGVRGEWEGFVAVVNKAQSRQYGALVAQAEQFIPLLPWGPGYEKDRFNSPDFTSLDVLGFAGSGIPAGINIPNYDDIRQEIGFKNVYLANVVGAANYKDKPSHLTDADWERYKRFITPALSINVGIHELLGHGSGKLLMQREDGSMNFDPDRLRDPLAPTPEARVTSWYKPGETYGSVFGGMASAYEECRAEAVALYLCVQPALLAIFNVTGAEEQRHVIHICWLNMVLSGLAGLQHYSPASHQWQQAHMRARYCILQVLLRAERPIVQITPDEKEGLIITLDADRIATDGVKAIGELLLHLNVDKAQANVARGGAYFAEMTTVSAEHERYREIVLAHRKPRKQYVQPHTTLTADGTDVVLHEFDGSVEGMIASFVARHRDIPL